MTPIKTRVLSVLGQDNDTYLDDIDALHIIFEEAIWEIAQAIPPRFLSLECTQPTDPTTAAAGVTVPGTYNPDYPIEETIVLLVIRTKADANAVCTKKHIKEIPYEESHKALDSDSIFFATDYSPVWWKQNKGTIPQLKTAPATDGETIPVGGVGISANKSALEVFKYTKEHLAPTTVAAWVTGTAYKIGDFSANITGDEFFECITAHTSTTDSTDTGVPETSGYWREVEKWDIFTGFKFIPSELDDIIIKRIAMKVLEQKLQNSAVQDEDNEVFTLLNQAMMKLAEEVKGSLMLIQKRYGEKELTKE